MEQSKINKINELARKSKEAELTPEEKREQHDLRQEYILAFRNNMKATLDTTVIIDKQGNRKKLGKKEKDKPQQ